MLFNGRVRLELTFGTSSLRKAATDRDFAREVLGEDFAEGFLSFVADMRNAMYLGELVDSPELVSGEPLRLRYKINRACDLLVQPVGSSPVDSSNWHVVHRAKLVCVVQDGVEMT
jgi:hypothetical protein